MPAIRRFDYSIYHLRSAIHRFRHSIRLNLIKGLPHFKAEEALFIIESRLIHDQLSRKSLAHHQAFLLYAPL